MRRTNASATCHPALGLGLGLLLLTTPSPAAEPQTPAPTTDFIRDVQLVHFSHTDVGFTDSPSVCRELYRRYLDLAIDAVLESRDRPPEGRFFWTAEATMPVRDWWDQSTAPRRNEFLAAVRTGQLEVAALPFNNTPFLDAHQWQAALHWLPDEVWNAVQPTVAVQNDVNGLPRAAAKALLDRGIRRLFTGINEDSGGVPFPRPSAFWWKQPDGRRLFVWLNTGYGSGFDLFEPAEWRRGPVPAAADTRYRPPRPGEILDASERAVRRAHRQCVERLRRIEAQGYRHSLLTISITSQWRFDNDPPFPPMADFVATWTRLGLEPRLRMATVGAAMRRLEEMVGPTAPEYSGEWTDWWANGTASAPRAVAASRWAKRHLAAARSPLWGADTEGAWAKAMVPLYRDLCLFDEHTWGSSLSVALPYSLDTQAQFTEKSVLAFRPMAQAEWLLAQRARARLANAGGGVWVGNPTPGPFSGWVRLPATALRVPAKAVTEIPGGIGTPLLFEPGIQPWGRPATPNDLSPEDLSATFPDQAPDRRAKFWVDHIPPHSQRHFRWTTDPGSDPAPDAAAGPEIGANAQGWPTSAQWPGMPRPLFLAGFGDFVAVHVEGFAPRHLLADIRGKSGEARSQLRAKILAEIPPTRWHATTTTETAHTRVFHQRFDHPRLVWGTRIVELWKREPRARLTLRVNRATSAAPEIFYLDFPLPTESTLPRLDNGGLPFTPFTDQLPGSCRDYFAIDGSADYSTPHGRWLWASRDAPLITFGASPTLARRSDPPADAHRLRAMIFDNFWYTNFVADEHGILEFQFDLKWYPPNPASGSNAPRAADLAAALVGDPLVLVNPDVPEDARVIQRLYQP